MKKDPRILIATPAIHEVNTRFYQSMMSIRSTYPLAYALEVGSLVYMARNRLAKTAVEHDFDYILWIDSDMLFDVSAVEKMIQHAKTGRDFVSGIFFNRSFPMHPVISTDVIWERNEDGSIKHGSVCYEDYPKDSFFEVAGAGFAFTLTKVEMVGRVAEGFGQAPFDPFPSLGEDYTFCWKAKKMGYKMWCDSKIKIGHIGEFVYDEDVYLANQGEPK